MSKTTEEKIDEIHDNVLMLTVEFKAFKETCVAKHTSINKVLHGNGAPGLVQLVQVLSVRFEKLETRLIAYTCAAIFIIQLVGPKVVKALGF